ncbi:MAG: peptide chain release factor N(5)-glutamine methyltransferase [Candidatus Kerfeldbacteria bacterium]|nr:peptide chain release factor N(5)-glutamine methyltransferase [Candidatus Kerfeldbacteria bacterium]
MTIGSAAGLAAGRLAKYSASPALDAEVLLSYVLKKDRAWLLAHDQNRLPLLSQLRYRWLIRRRRQGIPVAYLTHSKEFYGRPFYVNRHVLIPRPETELLLEQALGTIRANSSIEKVIDVGTGSGCMAVTLALEAPAIKVMATDISPAAISLARRNAARYGLTDRLTFRRGHLLEPLITAGRSLSNDCLLVANLPYLRPAEVKDELRFEPRLALDGGADGLTCYRELLTQLRAVPQLQRPGWLVFEIHPPTAGSLVQLVKDVFPGIQVSVKNDYAGWPRVLSAHLAMNN